MTLGQAVPITHSWWTCQGSLPGSLILLSLYPAHFCQVLSRWKDSVFSANRGEGAPWGGGVNIIVVLSPFHPQRHAVPFPPFDLEAS